MERLDCCSFNKKPFEVCFNCCSEVCSRCSSKCKKCNVVYCIWCYDDLVCEKIFTVEIEKDKDGLEIETFYCDECVTNE